ncbi:MAG: 16S rRNA (uracil(1498)-N(3))-methyltransferase [Lactobacillaceae bacterium]|jgi:16S rRNA (uracil1498-N3)-methyltransferase|nr:16S rRNA (uracil(1498)-N(3))-methyltransferase [Lactobacillaceae bacterium]
MAKIRIFIETSEISIGKVVNISEKQSHYLFNVMKQKPGNSILCFNGKDGEFDCHIENINKKSCQVKVLSKTKEFESVPDLWLLFAPLKKDNTDFVIEKATELGIKKIIPTITQRAISEKVRADRFLAQAIEASEQCRRVDIPEISDAVTLENLLKTWDKNRKLYFLDETGNGRKIHQVFQNAAAPCAILVGPEGGFDEKELEFLRKLDYTEAVGMGKRILRAETAAVSAVACWQSICGDWN